MYTATKYAIRKMRRRVFFSFAVVGLFAVAGGANTVLFSILDSVLLQATPFPEADRLFDVKCRTTAFSQYGSCSTPVAVGLRDQSTLVKELAYYSESQTTLEYDDSDPKFLSVAMVSSSFFSTLGVWPARGRWFMSADNLVQPNSMVILSDATWQDYFGMRSDIVGLHVFLDKMPFVVCGVMPRGFTFPDSEVEAWVLDPLRPAALEDEGLWASSVVLRLSDNADQRHLRAQLGVIADRLSKDSTHRAGLGFEIAPLRDVVIGAEQRRAVWILFVCTACVVVLVTANLANLTTARNLADLDTDLVRVALGATRARLMKEHVIESLIFSAPAAAFALFLAYLTLQFLHYLGGLGISRWELAVIGTRSSAYCVGITILVFCVSGFLSFWPLSYTASSLVTGRRSVGVLSGGKPRWYILQRQSVILQLAFATILVLTAASAFRMVWRLLSIPIGFESKNLVAFIFDPESIQGNSASAYGFVRPLLEEVGRVPHVSGAAMASFPPLGGGAMRFIPVYTDGAWTRVPKLAETENVSRGYFEVTKIPLLTGRGFADTDDSSRPCVATANLSFVHAYLRLDHISDALGRLVSGNGRTDAKAEKCSIIGVVGDTRDLNVERAPLPELYFSDLQHFDRNRALLVRTEREASAIPLVRAMIKRQAPTWKVALISPVGGFLQSQTRRVRLLGYQLLLFSFIAYTVSIVGTFAIVHFWVEARRRDIGVRLALGARHKDVLRIVIQQFVGVVVLGAGAGILLAYFLRRMLSAWTGELPAIDFQTSVATIFIVVLSALAACVYPVFLVDAEDLNSLLRSE